MQVNTCRKAGPAISTGSSLMEGQGFKLIQWLHASILRSIACGPAGAGKAMHSIKEAQQAGQPEQPGQPQQLNEPVFCLSQLGRGNDDEALIGDGGYEVYGKPRD
eukprot:1153698-Pelagomonas_calceolata.AAC.4